MEKAVNSWTSKMGPKHMGKNNVFINDAGQISETLLEV